MKHDKAILPSDVAAAFLYIADQEEPRIRDAILTAFEQTRRREGLAAIADMISVGNFAGVAQVYEMIGGAEWAAMEGAVAKAVQRASKYSIQVDKDALPATASSQWEAGLGLNPRLQRYTQALVATRVREMDLAQKDTIRTVIARGLDQGSDPYAIARSVRGSIGLTHRQTAAIFRYERELRQLDPRALDRALRDRRSDRSILRAIQSEQRLPDKQIRSLVERYRQRFLKYRSQVIARTESIRAVQGAQWELHQSMIEQGLIDKRQVERTWIHSRDERVRESHLLIPAMNPNGRGQDDPFDTPEGPLMYPGDPDGRASNTIQCRCAVYARIRSRELIPGIGQPPVKPPRPPGTEEDPFAATDPWREKSQDERYVVAPAFSKARPEALAAVAKFGALSGGVRYTGTGAYYRRDDGGVKGGPANYISMMGHQHEGADNAAFQAVMRHEYGHHISQMMADRLQEHRTGMKRGADTPWVYARKISELGYDAIHEDALRAIRNQGSTAANPRSPSAQQWKKPKALAERRLIDRYNQLELDYKADIQVDPRDAVLARMWRERGLDREQMKRGLRDLTFRDHTGEIQFLAAWDVEDVHEMIGWVRADYYDNWAPGMSDTLGAVTNYRLTHSWAHKLNYYKRDVQARRTAENWVRQSGPQHVDMRTLRDGAPSPSQGAFRYASKNTDQAWANWFEAYSSGDDMQYSLFKRLFPATSQRFEDILAEMGELL